MNTASFIPVTGATALYAIVGDPVSQVRSPQVVNALFAQAQIDALLVPMHVSRDRFGETMRSLMAIGNLRGIVITVPFKVDAMSLVSHVLPGAQAAGALNAMRRLPDNRWEGDMFDGAGLVRALDDAGHPPAGKRVLLVGAGGAGRAIAIALAQSGVREIALSDIDGERVRQVVEAVANAAPSCICRACEPTFDGHDLVVNATPLGMKPDDALPVDIAGMNAQHVLFDIVPKPDVTALMRAAQSQGVTTIGGKRMIEGQARALAGFFGHRV
ncbi:shikimate dehydrogenase family protein [Paraburkholderia caledonica]|uniref:Shikimate dehydrogenase n=1 Tax=Paraburkholderia caledonica TaxID=134536 RepID=A0ABU1L0U0_9BURK|nr:shikimate dehydrogenase [Paraburkholderia caledonica]MDR6376838.1 shikimate dehydrogenase [Paraburkholderia caledonica]